MKDKSTILIMSRAAVVNFNDLYKFLKKRNVFAGIDVYPLEPVKKSDPIRKLQNVIFSPHYRASSIALRNSLSFRFTCQLIKISVQQKLIFQQPLLLKK